MKLYEGISFLKHIGYFVIWIGGTLLTNWLLSSSIFDKEALTSVFLYVFCFTLARIAYLEDLIKEVEKRLNK